MTGLPLWLLQASTDPTGPAQWTFRNWLGLGCQVVVFILLVAFIFWLADLKNAGPEADGDTPKPEAPTPEAGESAPAPAPEPEPAPETPAESPETPAEPSEPTPEASTEPSSGLEPPAGA